MNKFSFDMFENEENIILDTTDDNLTLSFLKEQNKSKKISDDEIASSSSQPQLLNIDEDELITLTEDVKFFYIDQKNEFLVKKVVQENQETEKKSEPENEIIETIRKQIEPLKEDNLNQGNLENNNQEHLSEDDINLLIDNSSDEIIIDKPTFLSQIKFEAADQIENVKVQPTIKKFSSPYHFNDYDEFQFNLPIGKLKLNTIDESSDAAGLITKVNLVKMLLNEVGIVNEGDITYGESYKYQWIQIVFEKNIDKDSFEFYLTNNNLIRRIGRSIHLRDVEYNILRIEIGHDTTSAIKLRNLLETRQYTKQEPTKLILGFDKAKETFSIDLDVNNIITINGDTKNFAEEFINTFVASLLFKKDSRQFKFAFLNNGEELHYKNSLNTFFNDANKINCISMLENLSKEIDERIKQRSLKFTNKSQFDKTYLHAAKIVVFIDNFEDFILSIPEDKGNFVFELMEKAKDNDVYFVLSLENKRPFPSQNTIQFSFASEFDMHLFKNCDCEVTISNENYSQRVYTVLTDSIEMQEIIEEMEKQRNEKGIGIKTSQ